MPGIISDPNPAQPSRLKDTQKQTVSHGSRYLRAAAAGDGGVGGGGPVVVAACESKYWHLPQ